MRYSPLGRKDVSWTQDGDPGFRGIRMDVDPSILEPGYLSKSENKRLREGAAATRPGTAFPGEFNPVFSNRLLGSGVFNNPNGDQVLMVAELNATFVWVLQYNKDPIKINLPVGENTGIQPWGVVQFVQAFEKVLLLRFPTQIPLVWDGNTAHNFADVTLVSPGLNLIPSNIMGVPYKNQLVLYSPYVPSLPYRDQVIITDQNNLSSYDPVWGAIRINSGESDVITSVKPYFEDSVIVFKKQSIHILENFTTPIALGQGSGAQRLLTDQFGGVSIRMPLLVGRDVIFASEPGGFYRISELIQDQITTQPVAISRRIQPIIDQIDWERMRLWGCSEILGDYAYFGITRKGTPGYGLYPACDAVVVLNTVSNEWESAPDFRDDPSFLINALHVTNYNGSQRLFAVDYFSSRILLMDEGFEDEVSSGNSIAIKDTVRSRGFVCNDPSVFKAFQRATIGIKTSNPDAVVTSIVDGVNEELELGVIQKDRKKSYIHGKTPNIDDQTEPMREDYSGGPEESNVCIEDFEDYTVGDINFLQATGQSTDVGPKQQSLEHYRIKQRGRYCILEVANVGGQCDIIGWSIDAIPTREGIKTLA